LPSFNPGPGFWDPSVLGGFFFGLRQKKVPPKSQRLKKIRKKKTSHPGGFFFFCLGPPCFFQGAKKTGAPMGGRGGENGFFAPRRQQSGPNLPQIRVGAGPWPRWGKKKKKKKIRKLKPFGPPWGGGGVCQANFEPQKKKLGFVKAPPHPLALGRPPNLWGE